MAKRGKRTGKGSAASVKHTAKVQAALEARLAGKTFDEIAKDVGWNSRHAAYMAVTRALDRQVREPATQLVDLELQRLDKMFELHFLNAQTGDVQATTAVLRIMERRAAMLGLDAAKEVNAKVTATVAGGVLVTPGIMDHDQWVKSVAQQQADLKAAEDSVRVDESP